MNREKFQGFLLIDLMIGMALSVFVIGALLTFMVGNIGQSRTNMMLKEHAEEMSTAAMTVERMIAMAGYNPTSIGRLAPGVQTLAAVATNHNYIYAVNNCIIFGADLAPRDGVIANTEIVGVRVLNGRLQAWNDTVAAGATTITCEAASAGAAATMGWFDMIDSNIVNVRGMQIINQNNTQATGNYVSSNGFIDLLISVQDPMNAANVIGRRQTIELRNNPVVVSNLAVAGF